MVSIWRDIIYQGKNMLRDKSFTFWGLLYPIILTSFFYISFSGLTNPQLEDINLGLSEDNPTIEILSSIDILNLIEIPSESANYSLESGNIDVYLENDLSILVAESGSKQTIVKSIISQIDQTTALGEPMENFDFSADYIAEKSQESNSILIIFYSLIAMVSTYGVFGGIECVNIVQANMSNLGARINTTPIKKSRFLISGLTVSLFVNLLSNLLLFLFIEFILKLNLFQSLGYSMIFVFLGNLFGVSLCIFIGSSNKKSSGFKSMVAIVTTLFMAFLSGLVSQDIKVLIDTRAPILAKLNPISIITNNLYRINLLDIRSELSLSILILCAYSIVLILGSYFFLRRRRFDSI